MYPHPWRGEQYGLPNDLGLPPRLLILGESHHGHYEPIAEYTRAVVMKHIERGSIRFLRKIGQTILGVHRYPTPENRRRFWDAVAFYNFVPTPMARANVRPTPEQWAEGQLLFLNRLAELLPTHVIACGFMLWDRLPNDGFVNLGVVDAALAEGLWNLFPGRNPQHEYANDGWAGRYEYDGGACSIVKIRHPSARNPHFKPDKWRPFLQHFLHTRSFGGSLSRR